MYVCITTRMLAVGRGQKRSLGLQAVMNYHVGAGNRTCVFCKTKCSSLLSHVSSLIHFFKALFVSFMSTTVWTAFLYVYPVHV